MATRAFPGGPAAAAESETLPARPRLPLTRLPAWFPVLLVLATSVIELALADRKYGLFTGGFGQSRAVDSPGELTLFFFGYTLVQGLLGVAGWWLAVKLARRRGAWAACFVFALINGALFCGLLTAQYQLHSYFSDAVSFALIKELGGGSVSTAILYSLNEISVAIGALAVLAIVGWMAWRVLAGWLAGQNVSAKPPSAAFSAALAIAALPALFVIPRGGSDAAYGLNRTLGWQAATNVLNLASDVDRDGYGVFATQHDAAPFDGARHPLALDIPGNGVDEDGYGGDLALVGLSAPASPLSLAEEQRKHLVIVVMETLRGDVLGKRIDGKVVAPNLEALAAGGDSASSFSHVGFTAFSLKSMFSGRVEAREGASSLFGDLDANGYRIGVYSGQAEDFGGIAQVTGNRQHADVFVDSKVLRDKRVFSSASEASLKVHESALLESFDATLGARTWALPHFLYFNFQAAHFPYHHEGMTERITGNPLPRSDISAANGRRLRETYWNAVAHADVALGALVARLKALGVWENTLLLVTGDHGESLFEDGFLGHGHIINRQQYETVLVANLPDTLPDGPVALADYRDIIGLALQGLAPRQPRHGPFMMIGPLESPTAIGLAGPGRRLTSLRLDTGEACMVERGTCAPYAALSGTEKARADAAVSRWGSERWRQRQRRH